MKKVLVSVLSLMLVLALSVSVFATGGFVKSPSLNSAPTVEDFTPGSDGCATAIIVTPYVERHELEVASQQRIESAYAEIQTSTDLTVLTAELADVAAEKKIEAGNLAVSDLFDIDIEGCTDHANHDAIQIKLGADTLENFVALLHKTENGWDVVESAKVEGDLLTFSVKTFSPFAIVVETEADTPSTGDNALPTLWIVLMAVSAVAIVTILVVLKKKKSN